VCAWQPTDAEPIGADIADDGVVDGGCTKCQKLFQQRYRGVNKRVHDALPLLSDINRNRM
jgi:hypothetical protein